MFATIQFRIRYRSIPDPKTERTEYIKLTFFLFALCGCESWSLTLREEHMYNMCLRTKF
jgi:hypothetical protein